MLIRIDQNKNLTINGKDQFSPEKKLTESGRSIGTRDPAEYELRLFTSLSLARYFIISNSDLTPDLQQHLL